MNDPDVAALAGDIGLAVVMIAFFLYAFNTLVGERLQPRQRRRRPRQVDILRSEKEALAYRLTVVERENAQLWGLRDERDELYYLLSVAVQKNAEKDAQAHRLAAENAELSERLNLAAAFIEAVYERYAERSDGGWRVVQ